MRIFFLCLLMVGPPLDACTPNRYTVTVHKPKQRKKPYNPGKDRHKKRIRTVRMKN